MKREYLETLDLGNGAKLSKEQIDGIMSENGKDIEAAKSKFADYDTVKTQLGEANKTIEGFKAMDIDGIKKAADDWKTKAETAEKDAAAKVAAMKMDQAIKDKMAGMKFTSELAKGAVVDKVKAAGLKLDDSGNLMGFDDIIKGLKESDAGAFVPDGKPKPQFGDSKGGGAGVHAGEDAVSMEDALKAHYNM